MIKRVAMGAALVALAAVVVHFGGWVQLIAFMLLCGTSLHEMSGLFKAKGHRPRVWPGYVFALAGGLALQLFGAMAMLGAYLLCMVGLAAVCVFDAKCSGFDALCSLFIFIYPLSFYAILILVAFYSDFAISRAALLLCVAAPSLADMAAFFVGTFLGKHPLCPRISPKKTVEGSVGSFLGGFIGGVVVYLLQGIWGAALPFWHLAGLGLLFGGLGQVGDLFASLLKRWADIKDYGQLFPGHGGVMDRLDSILMCAPVVFLYLYCIPW